MRKLDDEKIGKWHYKYTRERGGLPPCLFSDSLLVLRQTSLAGCLRRLSEGQGEAPLGTPTKKDRQLRLDEALDKVEKTGCQVKKYF
jgi:hypothetical protein